MIALILAAAAVIAIVLLLLEWTGHVADRMAGELDPNDGPGDWEA